MSTPGGTGGGRRLRTAGLGLFALAVVAVLIGLVVTVRHQQRTTESAPPPVLGTHPSASATVTVIPYPPPVPAIPTEPVPTGTPVDTPPPSAAAAPATGDNHRRGAVRVYNNSTIRGLAARAARDLTAAGWTVVEVGNYAQGTIPTTTAYYQEGTDEQRWAQALGSDFGMRVEPRFPGIENLGPGLVVIVTNDYSH